MRRLHSSKPAAAIIICTTAVLMRPFTSSTAVVAGAFLPHHQRRRIVTTRRAGNAAGGGGLGIRGRFAASVSVSVRGGNMGGILSSGGVRFGSRGCCAFHPPASTLVQTTRISPLPSAIASTAAISSTAITTRTARIVSITERRDVMRLSMSSSSSSLSPEEIVASLGPNRKIASEPFTWQELQDIVHHGDPTMHSRSMEVQEKYLLHTREVKRTWRSMNDYILYSKFGFERILDNHSGLFLSCLEDWKMEGSSSCRIEMRLLRNEYPYHVQKGIEHWCLWKLGGKIDSHDMDMAKNKLLRTRARIDEQESIVGSSGGRSSGGDDDDDDDDGVKYGGPTFKEVLAWVNPPHLQSIPDIDHAHFLCLHSR